MDLENIPNKMQRGIKRADSNCDIEVDDSSHTAMATQTQTQTGQDGKLPQIHRIETLKRSRVKFTVKFN